MLHRRRSALLLGACVLSFWACAPVGPARPPEPAEEDAESDPTAPRPTQDTAPQVLGTAPENVGLPLGAKLPKVRVQSLDGEYVDLDKYGKGRTLILFYRGGWCPYCNFQVRAMTQSYPQFEQRGVTVLMISADNPDAAAKTSGRYAVPFPLFSDSLLEAHSAFNVVNELSPELIAKLQAQGRDPELFSGQTHHSVAIPAVFYFEDSVLKFVHADQDFRVRPGAKQLLDMLDEMEQK